MVAADRGHVVLARLAQVEPADPLVLETGVDQRAARLLDLVLKLEVPCDDRGHVYASCVESISSMRQASERLCSETHVNTHGRYCHCP